MPGDLLVRELLERWLEDRRPHLRQSSYDAYRRAVERNIIPLMGNMKLEEIQSDSLRSFVDRLHASGLSQKTVWDINVKLNAAMQWAVEHHYLEHAGYCVKIRAPKYREPKIISREDREKLERFLMQEGDPVKIGILISLNTGLQVGELCALRWTDIDLPRGMIAVERRMQRLSVASGKEADGAEGGAKKTMVVELPEERRMVPISETMVELLEKLRHTQEGYLLTGEDASYCEPRTVQIRLKKYLKECGLDTGIGFNTFRSTFICASLNEGKDLCTVSRLVGAKRLAHIGDKYRDYAMKNTEIS